MKHIAATALLPMMVPLLAVPARAAIVSLSFTGTYDIGPDPVFGLSGEAVPFNYRITYDTSLNTSTVHYDAGALINGEVTTHEWHGYSASGIVETSLTFGSQTWTVADLSPRTVAVGITADLWFDRDISLATPERSWIFFEGTPGPGSGFLTLGDGNENGVNVFMRPISVIDPFGLMGPVAFPLASMTITSVTVPEPAGSVFLVLSMAALGHRRSRRFS